MPMSPVDQKLIAVIGETLQNAPTILSAFNQVGHDQNVGFTLAAVCAMVQNESGGRMIWGADPWNQAAFPKGAALDPALHEQPVTAANYHPYAARRDAGMQPQGCGITQLTSTSLQKQADQAGGCFEPLANAVTGFQFLRSLFESGGSQLAGFRAYNGSGPAAQAYANRAVTLAAEWQSRINGALA
jgi:hypothetical protein